MYKSSFLDDFSMIDITELNELKRGSSDRDGIGPMFTVNVDHSGLKKEGPLENLIGSEPKEMISSTFNCKVRIDNVRTKKGWNYPSCGGSKCKKGIERKAGSFWCDSCNKSVEYPVLRFRLELDISDQTASTVVVMFDDIATELVKCFADSIMQTEDEGRASKDSEEEIASAWNGAQENAKRRECSEEKEETEGFRSK
ncbi:nucleic acid-binding, OB-fold protein [Tanacetum coccineum]